MADVVRASAIVVPGVAATKMDVGMTPPQKVPQSVQNRT